MAHIAKHPPGVRLQAFGLQHRGQRLRVVIDDNTLVVTAEPCAANHAVRLRVGAHEDVLAAGTSRRFRREAGAWQHEEPNRPGQPTAPHLAG